MKKKIFDDYLNALCKLFRIDKSEILSGSKKRDACDARHLLYYLCRIRPMTISSIQAFMTESGYDPQHTPIIRGIKKIEKKLKEDSDYQVIIDRIKNSIFI